VRNWLEKNYGQLYLISMHHSCDALNVNEYGHNQVNNPIAIIDEKNYVNKIEIF